MKAKVRGGYIYQDPKTKVIHRSGDVIDIDEDEYKGKISLFETLEKKTKEIQEEEVTNRMIGKRSRK